MLGSLEHPQDRLDLFFKAQGGPDASGDIGEVSQAQSGVGSLDRFDRYYPEHPDFVREFEALAGELGGKLTEPELSWKYNWIRRLFGWEAAKRARSCLPTLRWSVVRSWDKAMFRMQHRKEALC